MKKQVRITVKGFRTEGEEPPQETELITDGDYYYKNGTHYITYKESALTGMEGTSTTIKADGECVTVMRFGKNNSQFVFAPGKQHVGHYQTEYGTFLTRVTPGEMEVSLGDAAGSVKVGYLLDFAGQVSENYFEMTYEQCDK